MPLTSDRVTAVSFITEKFSTVTLTNEDVSSKAKTTMVGEDNKENPLVSKDNIATTAISDGKKASEAFCSEDTAMATEKIVRLKNGKFVVFHGSEIIPTKIEEGLYLGSVVASLNKEGLKKLNITHILTVRTTKAPAYPSEFTYKNIAIPDSEKTNIAKYFQECYNYIEEARSTGGSVLVHCLVGMSRSASIVIAYLMKKHGTSFRGTLAQVKSKRPIVAPNWGFSYQLQQYEKKLSKDAKNVKIEQGQLPRLSLVVHSPMTSIIPLGI